MGEIAGRPGGVGPSFVGSYRIAGRRLGGRFVVTAAQRPSLFQLNGTTTGRWARRTTIIAAEDAGFSVRDTIEYEQPGEVVGSLFGLLTRSRIEREFRRTYDNVRRLAESGSTQATSRAPGRSPGRLLRLPVDELGSADDGRLGST